MDELESLRVPPKPVTMNGTGVILNYIKRINAARQVFTPKIWMTFFIITYSKWTLVCLRQLNSADWESCS